MTPIPYGRQWITEEEIEAVARVLRSGWITQGPRIDAFEKALADTTGARYAVACSSGTAALHLICLALGLNKEDVVVTTPMTFLSTANAARFVGAKVAFCDIEPGTFNIDPKQLETVMKTVKGRKKVVIPVHFAGLPCDMERIRDLAETHGWLIVEDGCHALGAVYRERRVGSLADLTVFSFHPRKIVTTGEGGMVVTDREELAEKVRVLKFHGLSKDAWKRYGREGTGQVEITIPGFKYNLTDIQASLGITQLARVDELNRKRGELAEIYDRELAGIEEILHPRPPAYPHQNSHHLYIVFLDLERVTVSRDEFVAELKERNIGTGIHFRAVHTQDYYRNQSGSGTGLLPGTEWASERLFSLPLFPAMTEDDVKDVASAIRDTLKKVRK